MGRKTTSTTWVYGHYRDFRRQRSEQRRRMLLKPGVSKERVKLASRSRKEYWRMSNNARVQLALNKQYLKELGLPSLRDLWVTFKYADKAIV